MMKLVISTLVATLVAPAFAQTLACNSEIGKLFGSRQIEIVRSGDGITVRASNASNDEWAYQVLAESKTLGAFRAVRMAKPAGPPGALDAVLGGELFVRRDGASLRAFATGSMTSGEVSSEQFVCR